MPPKRVASKPKATISKKATVSKPKALKASRKPSVKSAQKVTPKKVTKPNKKKMIKFYEPTDPYFEFSNFYGMKPKERITLVIDGKSWPTTEHYYQAQKFVAYPEYMEVIRVCDSPMKVFLLGQMKKGAGYQAKWKVAKNSDTLINAAIDAAKANGVHMDPQWDARKLAVMEKALAAKFYQNERLKKLLLDTGDAEIVEDSPRDSYWGIGKDGTGSNMLGKLLEKVRGKLQ